MDQGLRREREGEAEGEQRSGRRLQSERDPQPSPSDQRGEPEQDEHSDQPELLAGDREDEVGMGLRQEEQLLQSRPVAASEQPAAAQRDQALGALPGRVGGGRRVEERPNPLQPIRR